MIKSPEAQHAVAGVKVVHIYNAMRKRGQMVAHATFSPNNYWINFRVLDEEP